MTSQMLMQTVNLYWNRITKENGHSRALRMAIISVVPTINYTVSARHPNGGLCIWLFIHRQVAFFHLNHLSLKFFDLQINLKNALRKRYARFEDDEIHVDEITPWGCECLFTIEFQEGKYAIRTNSGMYLSKNGKLVPISNTDTLYNIEFFKGCVAFKVGCLSQRFIFLYVRIKSPVF